MIERNRDRPAEYPRQFDDFRQIGDLKRELQAAQEARRGILPFLCPICDRKRVEYEATADGRLLVRCEKCGSDHDTICDAVLAAQSEEEPFICPNCGRKVGGPGNSLKMCCGYTVEPSA